MSRLQEARKDKSIGSFNPPNNSMGSFNLFYRPKGIVVHHADCPDWDYKVMKSHYVIQWNGSPLFNSGYSECRYAHFAEAINAFGALKAEKEGIS